MARTRRGQRWRRYGVAVVMVLLADADERLLLMGYLGPTDPAAELSAASTAEVLLFMTLGGLFLPEEYPQVLLDQIADAPELGVLGDAVEAVLAARPHALHEGDDELLAAVEEARVAILARLGGSTPAQPPARRGPRRSPPLRPPPSPPCPPSPSPGRCRTPTPTSWSSPTLVKGPASSCWSVTTAFRGGATLARQPPLLRPGKERLAETVWRLQAHDETGRIGQGVEQPWPFELGGGGGGRRDHGDERDGSTGRRRPRPRSTLRAGAFVGSRTCLAAR